MSYHPVQNIGGGEEIKEIPLNEDSETDIEGCSRDSEDTLFLGFKRKHIGRIPIRDLYKKACDSNVPLVVSLHLLVLNVILSVALIAQLWRGSHLCDPGKKADSGFAPGELLWS